MELDKNISNWHYAYMDMIRHWHAESEKYTGGDALFTALENGWEPDEVVEYEESWLAGARSVLVYRFKLTRGGETMTMPVVRNPYVNRIVREMPAKLVAAHADEPEARRRVRPDR